MTAREAHEACEAVTRREAANFYYGIRLLPPAKRRAMCATYAFARRIDDIGDGSLPPEEKRRRLVAEREGLAAMGLDSADPVLAALADVRRTFPLPLDAFSDLVDGVQMDVDGATYETFDDLVVYCVRVAGSIGRISVAIFGATDPARAHRLADDLGVAMQLTNILRDVREDAALGRVYLPAEDLRRFGCGPPPLVGPAALPLVRFEAERARAWFDRGLALLPLLDRRSAACVAAMTGIYRRVLDRIDEHPADAMRTRMSLPAWEKLAVAVRSVAWGRA